MGNTTKYFLISLFSLLGSLIIFINCAIWSDSGFVSMNSGTDYYFGFNSLLLTFKYYESVNLVNVENMNSAFRILLNYASFGIPEILKALSEAQNVMDTITAWIRFLGGFLIQPITFICSFILCFYYFIYWVSGILATFTFALYGAFNSKVPANPYESVQLVHTMLIPTLRNICII